MKQPRKNGRYSHNPINLLHWRIWAIVIPMVWCLVTSHYANLDNTYVREPDVFMKPIVVVPEPTLEDKIREYFPRSWKTMIPIAYAESGMTMEATGYNCFYNKNETVVYEHRVKGAHSTACKKEHRKFAWSTDCFVLQKNYPGRKTCPEGVTVDMHLREVAELSKVQGFTAWASFNQGKHVAYINK